MKFEKIFLYAVLLGLVFSLYLPVQALAFSDKTPAKSESTNTIESFWKKTLSSLNLGYENNLRDDGMYGINPTLKNNPILWDTPDDKILGASIVKLTPLSADQISSVKKAIVGPGTVKSNDDDTFVSWNEALQNASANETELAMPKSISLISDDHLEADVVIYLTDEKNPLYSGYTSNVIENQKIVKSNIIIYDIDSLDDEQISSIVRHELGHALGLMHSGSEDDLMFGIVPVPAYVSNLNVATLVTLYENSLGSSNKAIGT